MSASKSSNASAAAPPAPRSPSLSAASASRGGGGCGALCVSCPGCKPPASDGSMPDPGCMYNHNILMQAETFDQGWRWHRQHSTKCRCCPRTPCVQGRSGQLQKPWSGRKQWHPWSGWCWGLMHRPAAVAQAATRQPPHAAQLAGPASQSRAHCQSLHQRTQQVKSE